MAISVKAVRAYLLSDAQDKPLASPQALDLARESIPYGARVRFEVESSGREPLWAMAISERAIGRLPMFPVAGGNIYRAEGRLPWDFHYWSNHFFGVAAPVSFPNEQWPVFFSGDYTLRIDYQPTEENVALYEVPFKVGPAPAKGGTPPKIVQLEGPPGGIVRVGQPWLATAVVDDPDKDIANVIFSVLHNGVARWFFMSDEGAYGDIKAEDGKYSFLRIGGDWWDVGDSCGVNNDTLVLTVQAVDSRGNWSEPKSIEYQVRFTEEPLWLQEPDADGPNITGTDISRVEGLPNAPHLQAACDSSNAWVCARVVCQPNRYFTLFDDGNGPDEVAGDGLHTGTAFLHTGTFWDVVFYAVAKDGSLKVGRKLAGVCPPVKG